MKERLIRLLDSEQLSASKFADIIGVQRSSVSHVLSGRNMPSFDFLQKTLKSFPGLNSDWLVLGKGEMMTGIPDYTGGTLFDSTPVRRLESRESTESTATGGGSESVENIESGPSSSVNANLTEVKATIEGSGSDLSSVPNREKKVVKVMIFYADNTFSAFNPSE